MKTKEQIIAGFIPNSEYNQYYHENCIEQMMEEYSEQQAIAFAIHCNKGIDDRMDVRYKHFVEEQEIQRV